MSTEGKRTLIAAVRKVVFAGLILIVVWLILLALRGAIPARIIEQLNEGMQTKPVSLDSSTWDWTRSLWGDNTVSSIIGDNLGNTMRFTALSGLISLIMAGVLLLIGALISSITQSPGWLVKLRGILRLVLVSRGAGMPMFVISTFLAVFAIAQRTTPDNSAAYILWAAFVCALLPTWLLVQYGHGIIANRRENTPTAKLTQEIAVKLIIRLLKLVGLMLVVAIVAEQLMIQPGIGRLLISEVGGRDFPVIFGIAWELVVIVVVVKLIAELLEIGCNYSMRGKIAETPAAEQPVVKTGIPKGWLIFSSVVVVLIILIALFAPLLAPFGQNEIHLMDRLSSPSAKYLLGTDQLGRDILSRLLYGIRIDVLIGLGCAVVLSLVAACWGTLAAYCRKMNNWLGDTLEDVVMLPKDIVCSFPWLVLLLLLMSVFTDYSVFLVAVITGIVMLPRTAGIIQEAYHFAPGKKDWLQSVLWSIPVVFLFTTAGVIIYFSTSSYLGFGMPPGVPELGSMLSNEGRLYMQTAPWLALWPGLCLSTIIFFFVMTGDALLERLGFRSKAFWSKTME